METWIYVGGGAIWIYSAIFSTGKSTKWEKSPRSMNYEENLQDEGRSHYPIITHLTSSKLRTFCNIYGNSTSQTLYHWVTGTRLVGVTCTAYTCQKQIYLQFSKVLTTIGVKPCDTYSQHDNIDNEASIFSIGGYCA